MTIEILAALCDSVCSFTLLAFLALLLTRWRVACTNRKWGYHHAREDCSPMVREEFIRHAECHMQVRPQGPLTFVMTRALRRPQMPPIMMAATRDTGRIGLVCDSITRRDEGMGSIAGVLLSRGK